MVGGTRQYLELNPNITESYDIFVNVNQLSVNKDILGIFDDELTQKFPNQGGTKFRLRPDPTGTKIVEVEYFLAR